MDNTHLTAPRLRPAGAPQGRAAFRAAAALALALGAGGLAMADQEPTADAALPAPPVDYPLSAFSGLGSSFALSNHLTELNWSDAQVAAFIEGVRAAFAGKPYAFDDAAKNLSFEMGKRVHQIVAQDRQLAFEVPGNLEKYLQATGRRLKLDVSDSGLWFSIKTVGKGDRPGPDDEVVISCIALAADLTTRLPDLSASHFRVKVAQLLPGLREGVAMMAVGSQGTFLVPPKLTFGDGAWPSGVQKGSPLLFLVTLEDVVRPEPAK